MLGRTLHLQALKWFKCPECSGPFELFPLADSTDADDGALKCTACEAMIPLVSGIPRFVQSDNYADSFGLQWNIHRNTQLDSYTGLPLSKDRLFKVTRWPKNLEGKLILEAGSGAGRFTEIMLATGATLISFDLSRAVDANYKNNGWHKNLHLFQGDIFHLPLLQKTFDKVLCLGVLQHTPDPSSAFNVLASYVNPGGELVVDVYSNRLRSMLHWKYILRPITRRMPVRMLYLAIEKVVPLLVPISIRLRRWFGRIGHRLVPILEYTHWGLPAETNQRWAILDTFDMYSPRYDRPQSIRQVKKWFANAGFSNVVVEYGPNGVIGRGNIKK
jgi:SAM-dependent methyltransferase